jgi:hypothetical protein
VTGVAAMADRIGDFLVKIGAMKQFQVDDVINAQGKGDKRLFGEIAIEFGYIDDKAIQKYLDHKLKTKA